MKTLLVLLPLALLLTGFACNSQDASDPDNVGIAGPNFTVNYGNGIYFFPYTGAEFGNACSHFLGQHPDLEVAGVAIDEQRDKSQTKANGYFVIFRKKCQ